MKAGAVRASAAARESGSDATDLEAEAKLSPTAIPLNVATVLPGVRLLREYLEQVAYAGRPEVYLDRAREEAKRAPPKVRSALVGAINALEPLSRGRRAEHVFAAAVQTADAATAARIAEESPVDDERLSDKARALLERVESELCVRGRARSLLASVLRPRRFPVRNGTAVETYYNLHKHVPSVRVDGKVVAHLDAVPVKQPSFVVQQGGRQRVLEEQSKNVHAFIKGEFASSLDADALEGLIPIRVKYDPYRFDSFVTADTEQRVTEAEYAVFLDNSGERFPGAMVLAWVTPETLAEIRKGDAPTAPSNLRASKVRAVDPEGPNAVTLTLSRPKGSRFRPGQFVWVELPGLKPTPFAVSGTPSATTVQLTVQGIGATSRALMDLPVGASLRMSPAQGTAVPKTGGGPLYLIAGGSGLAPLRAVADAMGGASELFAGVDAPEDVLFADHLETLADRVHLEVSRADDGSKGRSVVDAVRERELDPKGRAVVVGSDGMMAATVAALREKGFPDERIFVSVHRYDDEGRVLGPVFRADDPQAGL